MIKLAALVSLTMLTAALGHANAQTFDFNVDKFRSALDQSIRADTTDKSQADWSTIKKCTKKGDTYICSFNDKGFQSSVAEFKKLDLANGQFNQKLTLTIDTIGGKVSRILLNGDRGDPVNILQFAGTTMNVMQVFEPNILEGEGKHLALAKELGIMRGDSAADIGEPVDIIKPYAAIRCVSVPSSITTAEACQWVPRS